MTVSSYHDNNKPWGILVAVEKVEVGCSFWNFYSEIHAFYCVLVSHLADYATVWFTMQWRIETVASRDGWTMQNTTWIKGGQGSKKHGWQPCVFTACHLLCLDKYLSFITTHHTSLDWARSPTPLLTRNKMSNIFSLHPRDTRGSPSL